jgi:hypothetical protein
LTAASQQPDPWSNGATGVRAQLAEAGTSTGFAASLAFQFRAEPHVRGGFNLYANAPGQIGAETRQLGGMFANLAAIALGWNRQNQTLNQALETRTVIGEAVGIVMERYRLDPDRAFNFLIRTSQTANIKLREVAAGVVADGTRRAEQTSG